MFTLKPIKMYELSHSDGSRHPKPRLQFGFSTSRLKLHNFVLQNAADERNSLQMKTALKLRHRDIAVPNNPVLVTERPIWVAMTFATLNRSHWFLNRAQTGVVADCRRDGLLSAFVYFTQLG